MALVLASRLTRRSRRSATPTSDTRNCAWGIDGDGRRVVAPILEQDAPVVQPAGDDGGVSTVGEGQAVEVVDHLLEPVGGGQDLLGPIGPVDRLAGSGHGVDVGHCGGTHGLGLGHRGSVGQEVGSVAVSEAGVGVGPHSEAGDDDDSRRHPKQRHRRRSAPPFVGLVGVVVVGVVVVGAADWVGTHRCGG